MHRLTIIHERDQPLTSWHGRSQYTPLTVWLMGCMKRNRYITRTRSYTRQAPKCHMLWTIDDELTMICHPTRIRYLPMDELVATSLLDVGSVNTRRNTILNVLCQAQQTSPSARLQAAACHLANLTAWSKYHCGFILKVS